jgi:hypothetical protein
MPNGYMEFFVPKIATQRRGSLQVIATRSYPIRDSKALLHFEESRRLQKSVSSRPAVPIMFRLSRVVSGLRAARFL